MTRRLVPLFAGLLGVVVVLVCGGCGGAKQQAASAEAVALPTLGVCRNLSSSDVEAPSNDGPAVNCADPHDAQTYAVGQLPARLADASYDDSAVAAWAANRCSTRLVSFLGADQSLTMRSLLSWVWFRPSQAAWDAGSRWYRCDVLGGQAPTFIDLPTTARNLLRGSNDDPWLVCATGPAFESATRVPCSQPHDWRAVTTIKVGEPADPYPGDDAVKAKTDQYCQGSVSAYLGYPADYDYAYTWFGSEEWQTGNRRSVCWAKTSA